MKKFRKKFPKQPTSKFKSKLEEDFNNFLIKKNDANGKKIKIKIDIDIQIFCQTVIVSK